MHELSMAQGIINAVIDTAESNNATEVNEVTIELGRLAMVNPEQLKFILGVLVENTIVEDAEIITGVKQAALIGTAEYDTSLISVLQKGDCIVAKDNTVDVIFSCSFERCKITT